MIIDGHPPLYPEVKSDPNAAKEAKDKISKYIDDHTISISDLVNETGNYERAVQQAKHYDQMNEDHPIADKITKTGSNNESFQKINAPNTEFRRQHNQELATKFLDIDSKNTTDKMRADWTDIQNQKGGSQAEIVSHALDKLSYENGYTTRAPTKTSQVAPAPYDNTIKNLENSIKENQNKINEIEQKLKNTTDTKERTALEHQKTQVDSQAKAEIHTVKNLTGFKSQRGFINVDFQPLANFLEKIAPTVKEGVAKTPSLVESLGKYAQETIIGGKAGAALLGIDFVDKTLNAILDGANTGDWSQVQKQVADYGQELVVGTAVVAGAAAAVEVLAIGATGLGLIGTAAALTIGLELVMGGLALYGAYEAGKAVVSIASRLYDFADKKAREWLSDPSNLPWLPKDFRPMSGPKSGKYYLYDPLVLDLNNNGIETAKINVENRILFDHDNNGIKTATSWIKPSDGFLVMDKNNDGVINNGSEMFGDHFILENGVYAQNGYEALQSLDSNHDLKIDSQDESFSELNIWQDLNQDGISQSDELFTLTELGIKSLSTQYQQTNQRLDSENIITQKGIYETTSGQKQIMGDVNFSFDQLYSDYENNIELSNEQKEYASLKGLGNLRDLRQAAALSPSLEKILKNYCTAQTKEEQVALLDDLLKEWAKTDENFGKENSRLEKVTTGSVGSDSDAIALTPSSLRELQQENFQLPQQVQQTWNESSEKLNILNAINGTIGQNIYYGSINQAQQLVTNIDTSYKTLINGLYKGLLFQTRLKPYKDLVQIKVENNNITLDFSEVIEKFNEVNQKDTKKSFIDLAEFLSVQSQNAWKEGIELLNTYFDIARKQGVIENWIKELSTEVIDYLSTQNGSEADDTLIGANLMPNGHDVLQGGKGNDILIGGLGDDTLEGGEGSDTYIFAQNFGQDIIYNEDKNPNKTDTIKFTDGITKNDIQFQRTDLNLIIKLKGTTNQITVNNFFKNNAVDGYQIDVIQFADESILTTQDIKENLLNGTQYADKIVGYSGNDTLIGKLGDDDLDGGSGNDILYGGSGNDTLYGNDGDDKIIGGEENDQLEGGLGNDIFIFGKDFGKDEIIEFNPSGTDINKIQFIDGWKEEDFIYSRSNNKWNDSDLIIKSKKNNNQLTVRSYFNKNNNDKYLIEFESGKSLNTNQIKNLISNGTEQNDVLYVFEMQGSLYGGKGDDDLYGGKGNDQLYGGEGNDQLYGGEGNDQLYGDEGDDQYIFGESFGHDSIIDNKGQSTISFLNNYRKNDFVYERKNTELKITSKHIRGSSRDSLVIGNYYGSNCPTPLIIFDNGEILGKNDIESLLNKGTGYSIYGGDEKDIFDSDSSSIDHKNDMTFYGGKGNDEYNISLRGHSRILNTVINDEDLTGTIVLDFEPIYNVLVTDSSWVFPEDGRLISTNSYMADNQPATEYIYEINEDTSRNCSVTFDAKAKKIIFSLINDSSECKNKYATSTTSYKANDVLFSIENIKKLENLENLKLKIYTYSSASLDSYFVSGEIIRTSFVDTTLTINEFFNQGVVKQLYADGDNIIKGVSNYRNNGDMIYAGAGNDQINTGLGGSTVYSGDGNDLIITPDTNALDYVYSGNGDDIIYTFDEDIKEKEGTSLDYVYGGNGDDEIHLGGQCHDIYGGEGNDKITTERFTSRSPQNFSRPLQTNRLYGGEGNDTLIGGNGGAYLYGGAGSDYLEGGLGEDIYIIDENDIVRLDLEQENGGYDIVITENTLDITDFYVEEVELVGKKTSSITGNKLNNKITGNSGSNYIDGGAGNDKLYGGDGNDTYLFSKGHGHDIINDYDTNPNIDQIKFKDVSSTEVVFCREGFSLILDSYEKGDSIFIQDFFFGKDHYIEQFIFFDKTINASELQTSPFRFKGTEKEDYLTFDQISLVYAENGDDTVYTASQDDIIYGGKGNDHLYTNEGNDILSGDEGDDHLDGNVGSDTYLFSKGHGHDTICDFDTNENTDQIKFSDVSSTEVLFSKDGNDLVLNGYQNSDSIRIQDFFFGKDHYIEEFNFSDKSLTAAQVITQLEQKSVQPVAPKVIRGTDGDDTLYTEELDDILYGGKGNDHLYTNAGNDILSGDEGDDHLDGNVGSDTYLFSKGHGHDTISDFDTGENTDQIKFSDVSSTEVIFSKDGNDLVLNGYQNSDSIRIQDFFFGKDHQIEKFYFSDNTTLDNSYFDQYQNATNIMINAIGGIHNSHENLNTESGNLTHNLALTNN